LDKQVTENHKRYLERGEFYKSFGYDIQRERNFIIKKAEPLYGEILEIGTGKGYLAIALVKSGYSFTAVDVSDEEQKIARLNIEHLGLEKQVDFKIENAEGLSFEDGAFDIIFSVNMVHHLTRPTKVMDELARIVSFEGKIILSDFSKEGLAVIEKVHASEGRKHGFTAANLIDIEKYFLSKGFKTEKHRDEFQEILIAYHQLI
jgi:2-polyprenyl-3-methyl-5-hydroxy-6-metoxy-1,4-benzoquinol methylase